MTIDQLTATEVRIVQCMADGYSNKQMKQVIKLNANTIETYRYRIFKKLKVKNGFQCVAFCLRNEIIQ